MGNLRGIHIALLICMVVGVVFIGVFLTDPGTTDPGPVDFDDTVRIGLTDEQRLDLDPSVSLPRAQVFFSDYRYVVGFYGVERTVDELNDPARQLQFGEPLTIYVTDYSSANVALDADGYPVVDNPPRWRTAQDLVYVVDSEAQSPRGETIIPFVDQGEATDFVETYGGTIIDWDTLRSMTFDTLDDAVFRETAMARGVDATSRMATAESLRERPIGAVVGEDVPTIQDGVDSVPEGTTVLIPPGQYEEMVTINRSVTLIGHGATISGDGNGTVIRVNADEVGIIGLSVDGVGDQIRDPDAAIDDPDTWDHNIELGYGHGDAGIAFVDVTGGFVADTEIDTPANGILLRDAADMAVTNVTIVGSDEWRDGFMGVMAMRTSGVLDTLEVTGGRDGVYMHRSHGLVVQDSAMTGGRFGIHLMYTSRTLLENNHISDQELGGIVLMTDPEGNAIVGNDVRRSTNAITTVGTSNYVADNVVTDNDFGIRINDHSSRYEFNTVAGNEVGILAGGFVPTNTVVRNDFIGNTRHVRMGFGPLQVWSSEGVGNYWDGAVGSPEDGVLDRRYIPTDPIDSRLDRVDGAATLAHSPGLTAVRAFGDTVPGLRTGVVDLHPLAEPTNPDRLDMLDINVSNQQEGSP